MGPPGSAALIANVSSTGDVLPGSRGVTGVDGSGVGFYEVTFDRPVRQCSPQVTVQDNQGRSIATALPGPGDQGITVLTEEQRTDDQRFVSASKFFSLVVIC